MKYTVIMPDHTGLCKNAFIWSFETLLPYFYRYDCFKMRYNRILELCSFIAMELLPYGYRSMEMLLFNSGNAAIVLYSYGAII